MIKKWFGIGLLVLMACLFSASTAAWAQTSCQDCRDMFKECRSDARLEFRECREDNGCIALRTTAREICKAEGRKSDACKAAREDARECKSTCRGNFHKASRECRSDYKACRNTCA